MEKRSVGRPKIELTEQMLLDALAICPVPVSYRKLAKILGVSRMTVQRRANELNMTFLKGYTRWKKND